MAQKDTKHCCACGQALPKLRVGSIVRHVHNRALGVVTDLSFIDPYRHAAKVTYISGELAGCADIWWFLSSIELVHGHFHLASVEPIV